MCNLLTKLLVAIVATIAFNLALMGLLYFERLIYIIVVLFKIFYFVYFEILTTLLLSPFDELVLKRLLTTLVLSPFEGF